MTDNPYQWSAEVGKEDEQGRCQVTVPGAIGWLLPYTRAAAEDLAARINGTNQPTTDALAKVERCLIAAETRDLGHLDDLAAANVDPQSRRLKEIIDRRRSELAVLLAPQPTDLPDGVSPWLGDEADGVALGSVVWTLPDDEWERAHGEILPDWCPTPNALAVGGALYLLRRKPQTVTVELLKDVAERFSNPAADLRLTAIDEAAVIDACRKALGR